MNGSCFTRFRARLSAVPTPAAGLALGIASLGWALENALPLHGAGQMAGALIATALLTLVALKYIVNPSLVPQDLCHPVVGSVMPTFTMALMVVSRAVGIRHPETAGMLWGSALCLHVALLCAFTLAQGARALKPHHSCALPGRGFSLRCRIRRTVGAILAAMVPSWFIPPVGIVTAALTAPTVPDQPVFAAAATGALHFGLVAFALMLPLMVYRLIFHKKIADPAKPTIAILAAPASLSLAGYLSLVPEPSLLLCCLLLGIALLLTAVVYVTLPRLLRLPFSPAFASFTFPLVIGATALYKASERLAQSASTAAHAEQLRFLASIELAVAALVVSLVAVLYAVFFLKSHGVHRAVRADAPAD